MRVRAEFEGAVDKQSGMVLNLMDVDRAFEKCLRKKDIYRTRKKAVVMMARALQGALGPDVSPLLKSISISNEKSGLRFELALSKFVYTYETVSNFHQPDGVLLSRRILFRSSALLKAAWLKGFRSMVWKDVDDCVNSLNPLKGSLIDVQIERPEWRGWQKWSWVSDSVDSNIP